ncbi:MAG: TolC family protein [Acidobacteriota bacterium]|nr:TolC family protein [Acidobacteriota bacterium]
MTCLRYRLSLAAALLGCAATLAAQAAPASPVSITLDEAIRRAEANEPGFAATRAESQAQRLEQRNAVAGLLPSVNYHNQYLYTQSNQAAAVSRGTLAGNQPAYIANNAVHEYISQAQVSETVGLNGVAAIRLANATAMRAAAELEVARRGLVQAVVALYYGCQSAEAKVQVAERSVDEANRFLDVTTKRETAREAAHADVIKARLGKQQRERELDDARLAAAHARLELGVLLFPDPATPYTLAAATTAPMVPDRATVEASAQSHNPELRSAMATLQASQAASLGAKAALLPDLALSYSYGIDAPQFAQRSPEGLLNLGYSASATVDLPVWDWLTSARRIKEARLRSDAASVALSATQRRLLAELAEFYDEATVAQRQLASLEQSVADARESLRLTNLRYVNGEGTVLDVVDAQSTLISAEDAQTDGSLRLYMALAALQTLTGTMQ